MTGSKKQEDPPEVIYKCPECSGKGRKCIWDKLINAYDDVLCWQCGGAGYLDWIQYAKSGGFINERRQ